MTAERVERLIRTGKWIKLRIGDASVYRPRHPKPPARIATAAVDGCDTFTFSDGTKVEIPYPPGVTAKRIGRWRVLVTYLAGDDREECHAEAVDFSADESADLLPPFGQRFALAESLSGQVVLTVPRGMKPDTLIAGTTQGSRGLGSVATKIRIR